MVETPAFGRDSGNFGHAVALSTEAALVVAEGGAYVFDAADDWTETATLTPADGAEFGGYDASAALVGDVAMVGDPDAGPKPGTGAVYLFERVADEWTRRYRFRPDDEDDTDEFGRAVAFDGTHLAVGDAHDPGTMVPWIGGAYVFAGDGTNWTQEATLGTDAPDLFGTDVAVADDTVLVGAPYAEFDDEETGAVYAYERTDGEWQRQARLVPNDPYRGEQFGQSVALDGDTAVVGAPGAPDGRAYVFERSGTAWDQNARVTTPTGEPTPDFGRSVAVADDIVLIGAAAAHDSGRAYAVRGSDGWTEQTRLVASDPRDNAGFGAAVALSDTTALVGSPGVHAAYLFDL